MDRRVLAIGQCPRDSEVGDHDPTDATPRCDVCRGEITEDDGAEVSGRGLLVFARGDELRYEEPWLCHACAAAIGITQLRLWDLEDDEEG